VGIRLDGCVFPLGDVRLTKKEIIGVIPCLIEIAVPHWELMTERWPLPSVREWVIWFPIALVLAAVSGYITALLKAKYHLPAGYSRKIFHFIVFTSAGVVGAVGGFTAVQAFGAGIGIVILFAVLRGDKSILFRSVSRPSDVPHERGYVLIPFLMTALGGLTSNLLFGRLALIGYIAAGWGDALGEPVGIRWGRHTYRAPTLTGIRCVRSIEGSLAVCFGSLLGVAGALHLVFGLTGWNLFAVSAAVALSTALVEALSFHGLDNLTVQIFATGTAALAVKILGLFV